MGVRRPTGMHQPPTASTLCLPGADFRPAHRSHGDASLSTGKAREGPPAHSHRQVFRLRAPRVRPSRRSFRFPGNSRQWLEPDSLAMVSRTNPVPMNPRQHPLRRRVRGGFEPHFPFHPGGLAVPRTPTTRASLTTLRAVSSGDSAKKPARLAQSSGIKLLTPLIFTL